jgi:hypothetical protein
MLANPRVAKEYRNPLSIDWLRFKNELASGSGGWSCSVLNVNNIETNVELFSLRSVLTTANGEVWSKYSILELLALDSVGPPYRRKLAKSIDDHH